MLLSITLASLPRPHQSSLCGFTDVPDPGGVCTGHLRLRSHRGASRPQPSVLSEPRATPSCGHGRCQLRTCRQGQRGRPLTSHRTGQSGLQTPREWLNVTSPMSDKCRDSGRGQWLQGTHNVSVSLPHSSAPRDDPWEGSVPTAEPLGCPVARHTRFCEVIALGCTTWTPRATPPDSSSQT